MSGVGNFSLEIEQDLDAAVVRSVLVAAARSSDGSATGKHALEDAQLVTAEAITHINECTSANEVPVNQKR